MYPRFVPNHKSKGFNTSAFSMILPGGFGRCLVYDLQIPVTELKQFYFIRFKS